MQITIKIIDVTVEHKPTDKGGYNIANVIYQDNGETKTKKVMDFAIKKDAGAEAWDLITKSGKGDMLSITMLKEPGKDGKEYYNWKKVEKSDGLAHTPPAAAQAPAKFIGRDKDPQVQTMIIRQSSLASAVNLVKEPGKTVNVEYVLSIAADFEKFVHNGYTPKMGEVASIDSFPDLDDDIPL